MTTTRLFAAAALAALVASGTAARTGPVSRFTFAVVRTVRLPLGGAEIVEIGEGAS